MKTESLAYRVVSKAILVWLCVLLFVIVSSLALGTGCRKPSTPANSSASAPPAADNPAPAAESPPATPQPSPPAATDEAQIAAVLNELTQAVRKFGVEQRRVPKSLEEVVARGYLSSVPPAPAGKKFVIDKKLQVYLTQ
jgi:hypothetical protein